jgi:hypothetical protein
MSAVISAINYLACTLRPQGAKRNTKWKIVDYKIEDLDLIRGRAPSTYGDKHLNLNNLLRTVNLPSLRPKVRFLWTIMSFLCRLIMTILVYNRLK